MYNQTSRTLKPLSKPRLNICPPDDVLVMKNNNGHEDDRQQWISTKGAFHQSFDERNESTVEEFNSCVDLNDSLFG
ncbi:unnamed protein product [Onchocerca flexuosa]|uniref:Uncharacterized protein n=1 Tax=Onchocerca flexuosa TaxID=387005 RepID=A0A183I8K3_9BILA|nr:unnamed protein product [Onchocerca flexuosa]